jgi:dipeptidyl aminopeptidase/acylaminoacyl peptidase
LNGELRRGEATVRPFGPVRGRRVDGTHRAGADTGVVPELAGHWSPTLAPDGSRVAYVSDRDGVPRVWVQPVDVDVAHALLVDTGPEPVVSVSWSPDGAWLACVLAPGGSPRTEVWLVRPDGGDLHQVAGPAGGSTLATAFGPHWLPGRSPGRAVLAVTETDEVSRGVLVDVSLPRRRGARRVVAEGDLLALLDVTSDGGLALLRDGPRGARHLLVADLRTGQHHPLAPGDGSTDVGCFSPDGQSVYARTDIGGELARLIRIPVAGPGGPETVAERADAELASFALSPDGATAALAWNIHGGAGELALLDLATGQQRPVGPAGAVVDSCAFAAASDTLAFTLEGPGQPRTVCVAAGASTDQPAVAPVTAQDRQTTDAVVPAIVPELHAVPSADGMTVTGWLHRPAGDGPYPTMLYFHGGPESQERPGYNPLFQSLVGQGIAVFAPNVRGSSGFGRSFVNADNRHGRYGAIADVAACVDYLVDAGIADPGRIGCMGRSYGGYLTLAALVAYPDLFAVGVDVCGMANFETFYSQTEPWIAAAAVSKYGHPDLDRELLRHLSPIWHIDRLRAPLLIVHGANDTNVPVCEAEQVATALQANRVPHRYLLFEGEGHELLSRASREEYMIAVVEWLEDHLQHVERADAEAS